MPRVFTELALSSRSLNLDHRAGGVAGDEIAELGRPRLAPLHQRLARRAGQIASFHLDIVVIDRQSQARQEPALRGQHDAGR